MANRDFSQQNLKCKYKLICFVTQPLAQIIAHKNTYILGEAKVCVCVPSWVELVFPGGVDTYGDCVKKIHCILIVCSSYWYIC